LTQTNLTVDTYYNQGVGAYKCVLVTDYDTILQLQADG